MGRDQTRGDSTRALFCDAPEADTLDPSSSFAFVRKDGGWATAQATAI